MEMMECILSIENVNKKYEQKVAVDDVSFKIHKGEIVGLLGPNGAGKTSLIRMITSITLPDSGQIYFNNEPLKVHHQNRIGYMPEERGLYKKMSVLEQLVYLLRLRGMEKKHAEKKTLEWLEKLFLIEWKNNNVGELSKGMQQKIQFILTVAHDPELLILDEPFSGLDPLNAQLIEDHIRELQKQNKTVLFSTHRMEQAESFCEQILLINQGKLIINQPIHELKQQFKKNQFLLKTQNTNYDFADSIEGIIVHEKQNHLIFSIQEGSPLTIQEVLKKVLDFDVIVHFEEILPSLSEIFIQTVANQAQPIKNAG